TQVQNAVHEQKDPLMVYKFEALKMFQTFIKEINEEILAFLTRATLMSEEEPTPLERQRSVLPPQRPSKVIEEKQGSEISSQKSRQEKERTKFISTTQPITSAKFSRNEKVSVRYFDGTVKRDVKFKTIEKDLLENKCILID
ncbi:MAG: preprotein translocase subunit SecA, partial [Flammeovirgaceae bacterium]|nr:preprotein translocase subunit SecA [Flammeovirgaceae bacterium]MDW8287904.1 preprotein translocase subunit SecA [Flammeovirgaceae bacterium]